MWIFCYLKHHNYNYTLLEAVVYTSLNTPLTSTCLLANIVSVSKLQMGADNFEPALVSQLGLVVFWMVKNEEERM